MIISLLGNLLGFLFFVGIIYLIIKSRGTHPEIFELIEGEEIVEMAKGDYWVREFLWQQSQNSGEFAFTNKRLLFKGTCLKSAGKEVSIPYSEILTIKNSFVGLFFPVAFTITTKSNETYKFAMMKRQHYIDLINQLAQNN